MKATTVLIIGSLYPPERPTTDGKTVTEIEAQNAEFAAKQKTFDEEYPKFVAACKALGAALARRGWRIMVGVPEWDMLPKLHTVVTHVVLGASSETVGEQAGKHRIIFYAPRDREPPDTTNGVVDTLQELQALPNVQVESKSVATGKYKAKLIPNVSEVDAVLLVGGADGTASIGYAAYSMEKPVVAITGFGGAAQSLADDVLAQTYDRYRGFVDLTDGEMRALNANWSAAEGDKTNRANAELIVRATEKLVKAHGVVTTQTKAVLTWSMAGMALLLLLWVAIYLGGSGVGDPAASAAGGTAGQRVKMIGQLWTGPVAFFLLLYISSLLGAGLRLLASYQTNEITRLTTFAVIMEAVISMVVAFGLGLFYLIGSISFTGTVVALTPNATTFANIAVSMSLLGLAAGYLVPLEKLRDRLQKIFEEDTNK